MEPMSSSVASQPALATIVSDVLGELAFMVSDDGPSAAPSGGPWLEAEIQYRGPVTGTLRCWCVRAFAVQLTANLLGIEAQDADADAEAEDALREFMNVLCGQLVTAWHGKEAVFNLSIPAVRPCPAAPAPPAVNGCQLFVNGAPLFCAHG